GFRSLFYEFADSFFIHGISGMFQQIRHDISCGLAERVREHTGNADIGNGHTVLDAVLFRRFHADQFEAVSGKLSELSEILRRNKRTSDKVKFVEDRKSTRLNSSHVS